MVFKVSISVEGQNTNPRTSLDGLNIREILQVLLMI
jgi:hypothetical protein